MNLLYCGIDISKDTATFSLLDSESNLLGKTTTFNNNPQGFRKAIKWLRKLSESFKPYSVHVSMEATNVYYLSLAKFFCGQTHITVSVVNPSQVKSYAKAELVRTKTDSVDAAVIARFAKAMNPAPWTPPEPHEEEMLNLLRHIESIKKMIQAEKNRLLTLEEIGSTTVNVQKAIKKHIKFLESQIDDLTGKLKKLVKEHRGIDDKIKLLCSIPGIGDITAYMLIAEIGNIGRFGNVKQLVAYAGIAPAQRQSGTSVHGKSMINKHGSKRLRKTLYMPAMVAVQYNPVIEKFYQRLLSAGKKPLCALVACMRKLLHIVYGVLKNKKHFDPAWSKPLLA
ncbi:MAG: IS110 family transposase [Oligoflexia bacterium]|nr:IS110 family transposase [Oligoflexia bacterium]